MKSENEKKLDREMLNLGGTKWPTRGLMREGELAWWLTAWSYERDHGVGSICWCSNLVTQTLSSAEMLTRPLRR